MLRRILTTQTTSRIKFYSTQRVAHEVRIPVPWGHVAAKWWEPTNTRPILALHGWQDNSGSFDRLIPLMTEKTGVLALDLPGHGFSSKLPIGTDYNNLNYPILIQRIAKYFNWDKVSLMGHSMGGISCYTYTMIFPENVDFLICIDGLKPLMAKNNIAKMNQGIKDQLKYDLLASDPTEPPSYTMDEVKLKVANALKQSIDYEQCHYIAARNIAESKKFPGKYYFTRDPRLKSLFGVNWAQSELLEAAQQVTTPMLIFKFSKSGYFENKRYFEELYEVLKVKSKDCEYQFIEGKHHNHLNNPQSISDYINAFIEKHDTEDRNVGGIKNEVLAANVLQ